MNDEKLTYIETTLAHQERQIQDLSEMINLQWKEIDRLKRNLEKAYDKINEIETGSGDGEKKSMSVSEIAASEKPPHY